MAKELKIGIQGVGILHTDQSIPDVDTKFKMAKEAGFDYVERSPIPAELDAHKAAVQKYGIPLLSTSFWYTVGKDEELLKRNMEVAAEFGAKVHNIQVLTKHADGHVLTDDEVAAFYLYSAELGDKLKVKPCFENHINMWSEHFGRVEKVADKVKAKGVTFNMTLDHSHVIFKMNNPIDQEVQGMRADVESGNLILDPSKPGNVSKKWIDANYVVLCQARPAAPAGPQNVWGKNPDGSYGRGVMYPG